MLVQVIYGSIGFDKKMIVGRFVVSSAPVLSPQQEYSTHEIGCAVAPFYQSLDSIVYIVSKLKAIKKSSF